MLFDYQQLFTTLGRQRLKTYSQSSTCGRRGSLGFTAALALCSWLSTVGGCTPTPSPDSGADSAPDAIVDSMAPQDAARDESSPDVVAMDAEPDSAMDAGADADAEPDATSMPDARSDARIAVCERTPIVVPAGATMSIPLEAFTLMPPHPDILSCVQPSITAGVIGMTARVTLSAQALITISHAHGLTVESRFGIAEDCTLPAPMCLGRDTYPNTLIRLLPAGTYEIQTFTNNLQPAVTVQPPPPPATNTTCATAASAAGSGWTSAAPRVSDAQPRFFRWRSGPSSSAMGSARFGVRPIDTGGSSGGLVATIRESCSPGARELARFDIAYLVSAMDLEVPGVTPNTDYIVEFSSIRIGSLFEFQLTYP